MAIYCATHKAHYSPLPSGYGPTTQWLCPQGCEVSRTQMYQNQLIPELLAGIAITMSRVGGKTYGAMTGFSHGAHLR